MSGAGSATALQVRPYRADDEPAVLDLLGATLGDGPAGERRPDLFRWKHFDNPFGPSFMLVAEADGRIVGLRAFLRWRFRAGHRAVDAVRAVDTATHPAHQGRGIFSRLTLEALDALRDEVDLVFNTPNEKSLPGYLKMGWHIVGNVPISLRVRRPVRFVLGVRSIDGETGDRRQRPAVDAEPAASVLRDDDRVASLLERAFQQDTRLSTPADLAYLRWRYGAAPLLDYRAVTVEGEGRLHGLALFRVRPRGSLWEATVAEVLVPAGDRRTALRLLRRIARTAAVDHLTCRFPAGSAARKAAARWGAVRSPRGMTLAVNPLRLGIEPDPTDLRSWALSLGDLEVF